jgi:hypothetical protein
MIDKSVFIRVYLWPDFLATDYTDQNGFERKLRSDRVFAAAEATATSSSSLALRDCLR